MNELQLVSDAWSRISLSPDVSFQNALDNFRREGYRVYLISSVNFSLESSSSYSIALILASMPSTSVSHTFEEDEDEE